MGEKRNAFKLLVGKQEGKTPLGSSRCSLVDNIKMDLGEIELEVLPRLVWFRIGASGALAVVQQPSVVRPIVVSNCT
jgi:hypothetical protein